MLSKLMTTAFCTFLLFGNISALEAFSLSLGFGIQAQRPMMVQPVPMVQTVMVQQPIMQPTMQPMMQQTYYSGPAVYAPVYQTPMYGTSVYTQSTCNGMTSVSRTTSFCQEMPVMAAPVVQVSPYSQCNTSFHFHKHSRGHRRHHR